MNYVLENKADKALREYLEAVKNHDRIVDKYIPVRQVEPGKPVTLGEPLTEVASRELEEAATKMIEALKKYDKLIGL